MSGITDEAAIEGHDLIHNAELHEHDNDQPKAQKPSGDLGDAPAPAKKEAPHHKESTLDRVKEALHLKK
ncbi:NADH-ubiquinone oxidoreductase 23 kDa subunit [Purpureocillium lavendulum]|uniref:NADH-ubiquinone oxidoreductase 23 kDa subunit n=1 Tax=Purpureocillium lavendulum TaxID=1247861 RepID=A0AB34FX33_9HYPO|nr:NADH-ubiquinone oxidoreductase 23 kDa subunit [Purpureocillium lavendulum]